MYGTMYIYKGLDAHSMIYPELIESLKLGNIWVFVQLIQRPMRTKNKLNNNPNIA